MGATITIHRLRVLIDAGADVPLTFQVDHVGSLHANSDCPFAPEGDHPVSRLLDGENPPGVEHTLMETCSTCCGPLREQVSDLNSLAELLTGVEDALRLAEVNLTGPTSPAAQAGAATQLLWLRATLDPCAAPEGRPGALTKGEQLSPNLAAILRARLGGWQARFTAAMVSYRRLARAQAMWEGHPSHWVLFTDLAQRMHSASAQNYWDTEALLRVTPLAWTREGAHVNAYLHLPKPVTRVICNATVIDLGPVLDSDREDTAIVAARLATGGAGWAEALEAARGVLMTERAA